MGRKVFFVKKEQKTLKSKLMRMYLLSIIIPLLLLGFVLTYFIMQLSREKSTSEVVISNNRAYDDINSTLRIATNAMNKFKADKALYDKLSYFYMSYRTTLPFKDNYEFQKTLDYYPDDIVDIQVITSNQTILTAGLSRNHRGPADQGMVPGDLEKKRKHIFSSMRTVHCTFRASEKGRHKQDVHVICIQMNIEK